MSALKVCFRDILALNPKGGDSILLHAAQARALWYELLQTFIANPDFWPTAGQLYKLHGYDNKGQQFCQILRIVSVNHGQLEPDLFGFYSPAVRVENEQGDDPHCLPLTHFLTCQPIPQEEEE